MLTVPAPTSLDGTVLCTELAAAGLLNTTVTLVGAELEVRGVKDADRAKVERIVTAHSPLAVSPEPSLTDRLAAVEARLDKAANAAVTGDAAKLRDNLRSAP